LEFALSIHLVTDSNSLAAFSHNETFSGAPMVVECTRKREIFMNKRSIRARLKLLGPRMIITLVVADIAAVALTIHATTPQQNGAAKGAAELLDGFRHVEAASVSDALEQVTGEKMYMSHRMRPIFPAKFAGFAVTVALKKESNDDPNALKGMLTAIDSGNADSVYVMSVEDGVDIAGMGGLMGTAMRARNFSGAVIGFASANTTVHCDGVEVNAGDIVVARRRRGGGAARGRRRCLGGGRKDGFQ
jgi:Aldolase/RraA